MTDDATWLKPDGFTWTLPSFVARSLCQSDALTPAELYFVLVSLNIAEQFREYWDCPAFFARAGMADEAGESQRRSRNARIQHSGGRCDPLPGCVCCAYHDWLSRAGDLLWAAGTLDHARRHYQRCIEEADGREFVTAAGIGGLTRLHFFRGEYAECIAAFRRGCPPHAFYAQQQVLDMGRDAYTDGSHFAQAREELVRAFPGTSPYFLSKAKYMCRTVVAAALRAGELDDDLRKMLVDYFEIGTPQIDELAKALNENDEAVAQLQKRVAPKPAASGGSFESLLAEGDTDTARRARDRLPQCIAFVNAAAVLLDDFLKSGDSACLDEMLVAGSPFGIAPVDALVLAEALDSRRDAIAKAPAYRLALLRRFHPICQYPTYDFLDDYLEVMQQVQAQMEPADVIAAILDVAWYKTPYSIDFTGSTGTPGGFGKSEISENREWLEIILREYPEGLDRGILGSRDQAISMLHRAYCFLRERFNELRSGERWINEAHLGDALATLFGKAEVQRHARPLWLNPQHLDFFLSRYALAVEYMGAQHYKPVEWFGGARALEETRARDERKRALCERMGVTLVYVTHEEDVGRRASEIYFQFHGR